MYTEINEDYVWKILNLSKEMFDGNLYVKCKEHPCGWDSIDIKDLEDVCDFIYNENISNGIYELHPYSDATLFEIIQIVGMNGWSFVTPTVCPDDLRTVGI